MGTSIFEIIGPIMIGPSSSHTAGAVKIGRLARAILAEKPVDAKIDLHGSFARTYKGHGTDRALVGGLLGFGPDDERLRDSLRLAHEAGLQVIFQFPDLEAELGPLHPNTARLTLKGQNGLTVRIVGSSIGGGRAVVTRIDDFEARITGEYPALVTLHRDKPGVIAALTRILADAGINIAGMTVSRTGRRGRALAVIETDEAIDSSIADLARAHQGVERAIVIVP
ncbi:MAG TPA: L-serine ammonia-lyase, iron-sulfur-dependent, subunit beta [Clostridia bacterium]|nr:L-serine ammonia-lyase, iron-sulfur-dependent, subunit beta [Clostridia bacterium]